jgi:hypothetical protein
MVSFLRLKLKKVIYLKRGKLEGIQEYYERAEGFCNDISQFFFINSDGSVHQTLRQCDAKPMPDMSLVARK